MKRVIAGILLLTMLFSETEFRQLLKLPVLFSHFFEHKTSDTQITAIRFLGMHYFNEDDDDNDEDRDNQLPFKSTGSSMLTGVSVTVPALLAVSAPVKMTAGITLPAYQPAGFPASPLADIWQPPRQA